MSDTKPIYWKTLNGRTPTIADTRYRYPVGQWTRHLDPADLVVCGYGYHLAKDADVLDWFDATLYTAEPCQEHGIVLEGDNKVVTCRTRLTRVKAWNDRTARLFAADCAERALQRERDVGREPDERSWAAVEAARQYALGQISRQKMAAAWAAGVAAWEAAWAAREAAWAAREAAWAAREAARAAARAAGREAAWAAREAA